MPSDETIGQEKSPQTSSSQPASSQVASAAVWEQFRPFGIALALVVIGFCVPLYQLMAFALKSSMYSYIPLMPLISIYLVWQNQKKLPAPGQPAKSWAAPLFLVAIGILGFYWYLAHSGMTLTRDDRFAFLTLSLYLFILGAAFLTLGTRTLRFIAFPLFLLIFMVPVPTPFMDSIEAFLQHYSAIAADSMLRMAGIIVYKEGLILDIRDAFNLPVIRLQVAPECSGIHSTWVLLITSLVAGYLFLRTTWKRALLTLVVLPLAILRNGFRIFVLGELCVKINPDMIDSPIHHQGGPIFFALSLIPMFIVLIILQKSDRKAAAGDAAKGKQT